MPANSYVSAADCAAMDAEAVRPTAADLKAFNRRTLPQLLAALLLARTTYANLTSDQFARGEDKPARNAIDAALRAAGVEID